MCTVEARKPLHCVLDYAAHRPPLPPPVRLRSRTGQGVEDSLQNQKRLLDEARSRRQTAEKVQASVKDDRKRFLAGTKELADECYKYEALTAHLALMRR